MNKCKHFGLSLVSLLSVICCFLGLPIVVFAESTGIAMTEPYIHTEKVFVCRKGTVFQLDSEMVVATMLKIIVMLHKTHRQPKFCSCTKHTATRVSVEKPVPKQEKS